MRLKFNTLAFMRFLLWFDTHHFLFDCGSVIKKDVVSDTAGAKISYQMMIRVMDFLGY